MARSDVDRQLIKWALSRIPKRAERNSEDSLKETFVELADLPDRLSTRESQILFGRRGTGKTHTLSHLAQSLSRDGLTHVTIDLRTIGSAGGHYLSGPEGSARAALSMIVDLLSEIHSQVFAVSLRLLEAGTDVTRLVAGMDKLADAASALTVDGSVSRHHESARSTSSSTTVGLTSGISGWEGSAGVTSARAASWSRAESTDGVERPTLNFGEVARAVAATVPHLPGGQLWLLMDEWSAVPIIMQPTIADFIRRCLLPCTGLTVKIAAVERRSQFAIAAGHGYIGLELGSDIFVGLDLDEYLAGGLKQTPPQTKFYHQLLNRHIASTGPRAQHAHWRVTDVISDFQAAVYFAAGTPRDLLGICSQAASRSAEPTVTFEDIARAARSIFLQEKEAQAWSTPRSRAIGAKLREIAQSRTMRFMVDRLYSDSDDDLLSLLDERIVHLLDRAVGPAGRYDVFAIDLGMIADTLAADGHLVRSANPWDNWDHVKPAHKDAPILDLSGKRVSLGVAG